MKALADRLAAVAGPAARIEARWLAEAAGGDAVKLEAFVGRRLAGEPVDRIIGSRGFWSLDLAVHPGVLSPRSDTETLVRAALARARALKPADHPWRILDWGVGSGAILLALLAELPAAAGLGLDVSEAALAAAAANAARTGLGGRARFAAGGWETEAPGRFDIVVSNPPYIPTAEIATLDPEVRDHDPLLALDGGPDGLACYRDLLPALGPVLADDGFAVLEFGDGQGSAVAAIARAAGLVPLEFHNDLNGLQRAVTVTKGAGDTVNKT